MTTSNKHSKVHVPGLVKDGVQKCFRCGCKLFEQVRDDERGWQNLVVSDGRGNMSVIQRFADGQHIRMCRTRPEM